MYIEESKRNLNKSGPLVKIINLIWLSDPMKIRIQVSKVKKSVNLHNFQFFIDHCGVSNCFIIVLNESFFWRQDFNSKEGLVQVRPSKQLPSYKKNYVLISYSKN